MAHIPKWCGVCETAVPHYFCNTENKYICNDCNGYCHKRSHNWEELKDEPKTKKG